MGQNGDPGLAFALWTTHAATLDGCSSVRRAQNPISCSCQKWSSLFCKSYFLIRVWTKRVNENQKECQRINSYRNINEIRVYARIRLAVSMNTQTVSCVFSTSFECFIPRGMFKTSFAFAPLREGPTWERKYKTLQWRKLNWTGKYVGRKVKDILTCLNNVFMSRCESLSSSTAKRKLGNFFSTADTLTTNLARDTILICCSWEINCGSWMRIWLWAWRIGEQEDGGHCSLRY